MVLTEDQQVDAYPAATMETAQAATEEAYYAGVNTTRTGNHRATQPIIPLHQMIMWLR